MPHVIPVLPLVLYGLSMILGLGVLANIKQVGAHPFIMTVFGCAIGLFFASILASVFHGVVLQ